jgi:TrpR-related protein YerC/YecD
MTSARARAIVNPKLKDPLADRFCAAVLTLKTVDECYRFFEDVCTIGELKAMAQRLEIARLLFEGRTYGEVARRTHASSATISRVRRFLEYGADGYRLVLGRLGVHSAAH